MANICQRTCDNCVKGRITGYNYQLRPLYTCRPTKELSETLSHLSISDCQYHETYEERFHEKLDSFSHT